MVVVAPTIRAETDVARKARRLRLRNTCRSRRKHVSTQGVCEYTLISLASISGPSHMHSGISLSAAGNPGSFWGDLNGLDA